MQEGPAACRAFLILTLYLRAGPRLAEVRHNALACRKQSAAGRRKMREQVCAEATFLLFDYGVPVPDKPGDFLWAQS